MAIVNWLGITDIAGIDEFYTNKGELENYAAVWVGAKSRMSSKGLLSAAQDNRRYATHYYHSRQNRFSGSI